MLPLLVLLGSVFSARLGRCDSAEEDAPSPPDRATAVRIETMDSYRRAILRSIVVMREQLENPLTLNDLAKHAYISAYHYNRIFRRVVGIPPCQFLGALRLQGAKSLLVDTHLSVTEICFEVGYNSLGTFTRRFTGLVGATPRHIRALAYRPPIRLADLPLNGLPPASGPALRGTIEMPGDLRGVALVALFRTPLPQGRPVAFALAQAPGPFALHGCPDGRYHLFVAVPPADCGSRDLILGHTSLLGFSPEGPVRISGGRGELSAPVAVRRMEPFDPPILVTFPLLLLAHLAAAGAGAAGLRAIPEKL